MGSGQYSKQLMSFVEGICQSISITKQVMQKNIQLSMSHKDQIINDQANTIQDLQGEIEGLKARLIDEEKILSEERMEEVRRDIREFLGAQTIGD